MRTGKTHRLLSEPFAYSDISGKTHRQPKCSAYSIIQFLYILQKLRFPVHQIIWVIEYLIFLHGLAWHGDRNTNKIWHKGIA